MDFHSELQMLLNKHKVDGMVLVTFTVQPDKKPAPMVLRAISTNSAINFVSEFLEAHIQSALEVGVEAGIFEGK